MKSLSLFFFILVTNAIFLVFTLLSNWSLIEVAVMYWYETIVIATLSIVKVLVAKTSNRPKHETMIGVLLFPLPLIILFYYVLFVWGNGFYPNNFYLFIFSAAIFLAEHIISFYKGYIKGAYNVLSENLVINVPAFRIVAIFPIIEVLRNNIESIKEYLFIFLIIIAATNVITTFYDQLFKLKSNSQKHLTKRSSGTNNP